MRKTYLQLNHYYPKHTYDRLARKEIKSLLLQFNSTYYSFFPHLIAQEAKVVIDYYPKMHSKQYEVDRIMELCKLQKVRRKDKLKIEEFLNLKYIIEAQLNFYKMNLEKVAEAEVALENEVFKSFFPSLFEERKCLMNEMRVHYEEMTAKLQDENRQCEQRIEELLRKGQGLLGEASKLVGEVITESMKRVTRPFKWKS